MQGDVRLRGRELPGNLRGIVGAAVVVPETGEDEDGQAGHHGKAEVRREGGQDAAGRPLRTGAA